MRYRVEYTPPKAAYDGSQKVTGNSFLAPFHGNLYTDFLTVEEARAVKRQAVKETSGEFDIIKVTTEVVG